MTICFPAPLTVVGLSRGKTAGNFCAAAIGVSRWPTDPVGSTTVTFAGVNAGCEIRVFDIDGIELAGIESCAADQVLSWSVFASGSAYNTVTVRIIGVAYKIKEFNFTSTLGTVTLPVQQEPDPWYSNP